MLSLLVDSISTVTANAFTGIRNKDITVMNDIITFNFGYIALKFEVLSILDEITGDEPACNGYKHYIAYYGYC